MLTISQLARYVGVTVKAVRHYHRIGLLPEPSRDGSGYRRYDAAAVVTLIRINILAQAGVPLARVQELLAAGPEEFARAVGEIDRKLAAEVERLRTHRERIARLAAGDLLALPDVVVAYLDRLRALGVDERYVVLERDAWIMIAASTPQTIETVIALKQAQLDDPATVRMYRLISSLVDADADDPRVVELADTVEAMLLEAFGAGESIASDGLDDQLVDLLDSFTASFPVGERMLAILAERGWRGWTRIEQAPTGRLTGPPSPPQAQALTKVG